MPPDAEVIESVAPENSVEVIEDTATREDVGVEEKPYTLEDAVSEAEAKLSGKEQKEEPAKKEEVKAELPKEEVKPAQEKPAVADTEDEVRRALDHYKAMSDPAYQKMLYENLHKVHGVVEKPSSVPQKSPEEIELDEVLNSLDPGVRKAFEALASRVVAPLQEKLSSFERTQAEREQAAQQAQAKKEFDDFQSAHKEDLPKYEQEILKLGQKYPDLLRGGKQGLETLYRLASEEDRINARVAQEVEKALTRQKEVETKVKRFSASSNTPAVSHYTRGSKEYTLADAYDDAYKAKSINV